MRPLLRVSVGVVWLVSGAVAHAQWQEPPTIAVIETERSVVVVAANETPNSVVVGMTSEAGSYVDFVADEFAGIGGSESKAEARQNTQISAFSIRGTGEIKVDETIGGAPDAQCGSDATSRVQVTFTVPVNAAFSLTGIFEASATSVSIAEGSVSFTGFDENGSLFWMQKHFSATDPPEESWFFFTGTVKADTELNLLIFADGACRGDETDVVVAAASFDFDLDFGDRDGDGLLDKWEEDKGINVDGDPEFEIELNDADPDRKDLYVEIDVMVGSAHSQGPVEDWVEIQDVQDAFAIAPGSLVQNPIPQAGNLAEPTIKLHVRDGGHSPGHVALTSAGKWPDQFDAIKDANFGLPSERAQTAIWDGLKTALMHVYRYCLWADTLTLEGTPATGVAERPGNDFVVASGFVQAQYLTVLTDALAGTFMHELGHNLGLQHGGQDPLRYKPNYLSVMTYTYQNPWDVVTNQGTNAQAAWRLDYSRKTATTLDEKRLKEDQALVGAPGRQIIFNSKPESSPGSALNIGFANAPSTDWNSNQGPPESVPYPLDISRINWNEGASLDTLDSYTDWDRLWYHLSGKGEFEDGVGRNLDSIQPNIGPDAIDSILSSEWVDQTALTPEVFWDGFETGDISAWTASTEP